jgi:hypothetical protein
MAKGPSDAGNEGIAAGMSGAFSELRRAAEAAVRADGAEDALRGLVQAAVTLVGDREAHLKPGNLKPGEHQFTVAGAFLVAPDRAAHMLIGNLGFPPEQRRLTIPIDAGHPGEVFRSEQSLLLADTDEHGGFRQFLKTARMGSALYAPFFWQGEMLGQLLVASQARHTYGQPDLDILCGFAAAAGPLWIAHRGPEFLARIYPPDPAEAGYPVQERD